MAKHNNDHNHGTFVSEYKQPEINIFLDLSNLMQAHPTDRCTDLDTLSLANH